MFFLPIPFANQLHKKKIIDLGYLTYNKDNRNNHTILQANVINIWLNAY